MMMIWGSAESYRLEQRLSKGALIDPKNLGGFHKGGVVPKCPRGEKAYGPFNCKDGPTCPNDQKHTETLKRTPSNPSQ
jgi:hypothetical protein